MCPSVPVLRFWWGRCSHPHHPRVASVSLDTPCWLKALPSHPFPSSAKNSENPGVLKGPSRDLCSTGRLSRAQVNHTWLCFNTPAASGQAKNESKHLLEKGQRRKNPGEQPRAVGQSRNSPGHSAHLEFPSTGLSLATTVPTRGDTQGDTHSR